MKVAFVSVFPPNTNGIGDYTHDLARALIDRGGDVVVLADRAGEKAVDVPVDRCWSTRGDWVPDVVAGALHSGADVVHFQHGGYMGRDQRLPTALAALRAKGIRTLVTMHGVYPHTGRSLIAPHKWPPPKFHKSLGDAADAVIIHQRASAYDPLVEHGVAATKIAIIPHGTPAVPAIDPRAARDRLNLAPDKKLALFLGFIEFTKGVDTVVRAFRRVVRSVPDAQLVIAGRIEQNDLADKLYGRVLSWLVKRGRREGWIDYRPGYLPAADIPDYIAAADLMVFPYRQKHGSASGILHRTFAAGRPVVCSAGPKFLDAAAALGDDATTVLPAPGNVSAWASSLSRVLGDDALRARVARVSADLGRKSAWPVVADQHLALYRDLVGGARKTAEHR
jgi:glycosyltransferase involved in cell wall biosynthesis